VALGSVAEHGLARRAIEAASHGLARDAANSLVVSSVSFCAALSIAAE